jgi:hypothetical protein
MKKVVLVAFENYIDMVDAVIEQQLMCNKIAA